MTDVFNNSSNDYIYPGLSPCPGTGDDQYLQWTADGLCIIRGSAVISCIDFSDLAIPVNGFSKEQKTLGSGEVTFIPGLTKGLCNRTQGFTVPYLVSDDDSLNPYFMKIDLSINYYKNFSYTTTNIDTSANYGQNINIQSAADLAFAAEGINATSNYDPCIFSFIGGQVGYEFEISNVVLTIIDASENSSSPFPQFANASTYELPEDGSVAIQFAKYPNTAMQGIVLKGVYPYESGGVVLCEEDKWVQINHVTDYVTTCDPVEVDNFIYNINSQTILTYDPSVVWGPFIIDASVDVPDFVCSSTGIDYDPSYQNYPPSGLTIDNSTIIYTYLEEPSLGTSEFYYGAIVNAKIPSGGIIWESSIYGSNIFNDSFDYLPSVVDSFVSDSSVAEMSITGSFLQSSWIRDSYVADSSMACVEVYDSSIGGSDITYSTISGGELRDMNIFSSSLIDVSVYSGTIKDSSIVTCELSVTMENCDVSLSYMYDSWIKDSYIYSTTIIDSSILRGAVDNSAFVMNSTIEGIYTNAYKLWIDSSSFIWVIDDPTLSIDDPSSRVEIQFSTVNDSSLNNVVIKDSSIYNSYIQDSSIIRCTLYNVVDVSTDIYDSQLIDIDMTIDCSVSWETDSSTFYLKHKRRLEVGMSGCSTDDLMSAGDYLNYVQVNGLWKKVGDMYIWTSTPDPADCTIKNLVDGFYVFNPHTFPVRIEYLVFV